MKHKIALSSKFTVIPLIVLVGTMSFFGSKDSSPDKYFEIKGKFNGTETKEIVLIYGDSGYNTVFDTLKIFKDGTFKASGFTNGFTSANLIGNIETNSFEDPNRVHILIEEGVNSIGLTENDFKSARIESKNNIYQEYADFLQSFDSFYAKQGPLIKERNLLYADHLVFPKDQKIKKTMDSLTDLIEKNSRWKDRQKINYIKDNKTAVSIYLLQSLLSSNKVTTDFAEEALRSLSEDLQQTNSGIEIQNMLAKIESSAIGNEARDFQATDHLGKTLQLSNFKGKYVLLDFWAGWCKPCKKNHPEMKAIYNQYHDKGLEIIGVSFDRDEEEWQQSILAEDLDLWHQVLGNYRDSNKNAIHNKFNVTPIPAYILIDDKGVIVGRYLGADRYKPKGQKRNGIPELKQKLEQMLPTS
ncbi:thioredoxin-like domain-containing protein [Flavobacteriaceae bacterium M23B6Z8]